MTEYIVEHPLRRLSLRLRDKAQTSLEVTALATYLNMHQQLWEIKGMIAQYCECFDDLLALEGRMQAAYIDLEGETKKYGKLAGFADEVIENSLLQAGPVKVKLNQGYLQELITRYSNLVALYKDDRFNPEKIYKKIEEKREHYYEVFSHFDKYYFSPIIQAYDDVQIDTCSFDDDFDAFRELNSEIMDVLDSRYDEWEAMCKRVIELNNKIIELNLHLECISNTLVAMRTTHHDPGLN